MNKPTAIITVGCSASGKSTWAKQYQMDNKDVVIIERDNYREYILRDKVISGYIKNGTKSPYVSGIHNLWEYWNWKWEDEVTAEIDKQVELMVSKGFNIVFSDTNLNEQRRKQLITKMVDLGYWVEVKLFGENDSLDVLWKRDIYRKNTVGHQVLAKQYEQFRKQFPKYGKKSVKGKPKAVIFDIDGTLAFMGDRSPFDWHKVSVDKYNQVLMITLESLWRAGYKIVIMSGRDSVCRDETIDWIETWYDINDINVPQYELHMRKENDMRKDSIIKLELFKEHIDGVYEIETVFDDRPSVIRDVWMELGFKVHCVGNQNIEF
jgi:predicted kinase